MNKIYTLPSNENWICDRLTNEWNEFAIQNDMYAHTPQQADVIWLLSDWCWRQIPKNVLKQKKVITTVHHIVQEKFLQPERREFVERDEITTCYHVFCQQTFDYMTNVLKISEKKIVKIPYWVNQNIWKKTGTKEELREKYGLDKRHTIVGSFQRDTEGNSIGLGLTPQPKNEKGPKEFVDYLRNTILTGKSNMLTTGPTLELARERKKIRDESKVLFIGGNIECSPDYFTILLAGWRRQYIKNELEKYFHPNQIKYFELPDQKTLNELYQCLDLYIVSAKYESGPMAILECGLLDVPAISTKVGVASNIGEKNDKNPLKRVLADIAIADNALKLNECTSTCPQIPDEMKIPQGFEPYKIFFQSL